MVTSPSFVRRYRWPLAIVAAVLLVAVVAPFVYINVIKDDAPDRLSLDDVPADDDATPTTAAPGAGVADGIEGA